MIQKRNLNGLDKDFVASAMNHVIHHLKHMADVQRDYGDFVYFGYFFVK